MPAKCTTKDLHRLSGSAGPSTTNEPSKSQLHTQVRRRRRDEDMGVTDRVLEYGVKTLMTRALSSQGLHHDTLLWLINVASVYHLLTAEGSLMGTGDLTSGEDCCLRQRREKLIELRRVFVIFSCLQAACTHGLGLHALFIHSFLTYPCSKVLGQSTPLAHL